uniref:Rho-GAP domain-containing protein n=1 Tax=Parascaris equorum TaxID=6256 RepID=A0A914S364_PAREQ
MQSSERKDELQSVSRLEQRNQKMVCAVKNTRQILQSCIRSGSKDETVDKRKQLQADAKEFENLFPKDDPPLLADVLRMYGKVVGVILEEKVLTDQYIDEEKALSKAKEKLARTALDVEVCRKRLNGNHDESKAQEIQNEYGQLQLKLDNYKVFEASYPRRPVFGCHLEDHLRYTKRSIAVVLEVCCSALQRYGFNEKGLFRVSGNNNRIRRMKAAFDAHQMCGTSNELSEYINDPHSICSQFIVLEDGVLHSVVIIPRGRSKGLQKMSVGNLSIVFGPNLIDGGMGSEPENMLGSKLVETLLLNADYFFPNESYHQRLMDSTGGFDGERVPPRSTQVHIDNCSNRIPLDAKKVSPQTLPARSRPKWPAPPPPPSFNPVEEISSSLEKLNSVVSKSPSTASNDSMAEYGYSNAETGDEFSSSASMT